MLKTGWLVLALIQSERQCEHTQQIHQLYGLPFSVYEGTGLSLQ